MVSMVWVQKSLESGQIMPQMPDVLEGKGYGLFGRPGGEVAWAGG